ncbi:MAG: class I SAM-dependent methyltransferase [Actinomycetota bacterium]|nr:MAG: class I SAM-dependent methyltransferase [Actinomycetota bacterium]
MQYSARRPGFRYSFASVYEALMPLVEKAGLAKRRQELLSQVSGRVLEIGAGTGFNLSHYPEDVQLVVVEPNPEMLVILRSKAAGRNIEIIEGSVEDLSSSGIAPKSFDFVVSTFVLCSVPDPDEALRTVSAMLAPGGKFVFLEHVVTPGVYELVQNLATPLWKRVAGGCHLNRDLLGSLDNSQMVVTTLFRFNFPLGRPLIPHGIMGTARLKSDFFA